MGNPYYRPGTQRAGQVQALFGSIAGRYDLVNDLQSLGWHRYWKQRLVRRLELRPSHTALDVCCGTGDVAFRMRHMGARVVGVDFSLPMLRVALNRTRRSGQEIGFVAGDSLKLPFAADSFDVLAISYGLRNLADFNAALAEFGRVLRPTGRLAILDFGKPANLVWRKLYFAYLRLAVPLFGRCCCGDAAAYAYILESLQHYPDADGIANLLRQGGWTDVEVDPLLGGVMSLHFARKACMPPHKTPAGDAPPSRT
jgi:demethylmenaquinone methyltransferase / 2-methoxy-6-polyprenyl-1,4-benzoquinol methylase